MGLQSQEGKTSNVGKIQLTVLGARRRRFVSKFTDEIRSSQDGCKTHFSWKLENQEDNGVWSQCCVRSGFKLSKV